MSDTPLGWHAIDEALDSLYGGVEPLHYGTIVRWISGGPDPLDGVSIYESTAFDVAHWHYVGYGLTELYQKVSENPDVSGWGFELTFRLRRDDDSDAAQPPVWPVKAMQNLARYVFESGTTIWPNDRMDMNGPIALEGKTDLSAFVFVADPELPPRSTGHGDMQFVQMVGVTADELAAAQSWTTRDMLAVLAKRTPGWVTDLGRRSVLADPATKAFIAQSRVSGSLRR